MHHDLNPALRTRLNGRTQRMILRHLLHRIRVLPSLTINRTLTSRIRSPTLLLNRNVRFLIILLPPPRPFRRPLYHRKIRRQLAHHRLSSHLSRIITTSLLRRVTKYSDRSHIRRHLIINMQHRRRATGVQRQNSCVTTCLSPKSVKRSSIRRNSI